ncbi:MAG: type IV toxin-antitoxin system AbiEi family antitoxin [Candidatus Pseudobacter hemicellulosilyticus]|uniref:Type IV toxin-antitoxin system AbiEi family antitoxin n=1 Tax=Candidatus Pseudobacter hemicellulosilyticus TaxID=3121375 RepID=A0AAJ6BJJ9_9BACT|nr:MAG: type IV toxin-antitoxin system AbiEi family antitoxin [Pseudobacter sp.]
MNSNATIIDQAITAISEKLGNPVTYQLHADGDHAIDLMVKERETTYYVACKEHVAAYHVDQINKTNESEHPVLVVATHIAAPAREQLRKKGIAYLEANGNAFIDNEHTTIFIDGNKPVKITKPITNRAFTRTGLKAVFHLLNDPDAIGRTYRQLAEETGIALGNIKYIMDGLADAGFILPLTRRKMELKNKKALLERWIAGYRETLKPDLLKGTYRIWADANRENWQAIDVKAINAQWGGEAAGELLTSYLQAMELTVYTPALTWQVLNTLGLIPDNNGNVQVYDKFWSEPGEVLETAPVLLVYADLLITDDPRCIETAALIYDKYLKQRFEAA